VPVECQCPRGGGGGSPHPSGFPFSPDGPHVWRKTLDAHDEGEVEAPVQTGWTTRGGGNDLDVTPMTLNSSGLLVTRSLLVGSLERRLYLKPSSSQCKGLRGGIQAGSRDSIYKYINIYILDIYYTTKSGRVRLFFVMFQTRICFSFLLIHFHNLRQLSQKDNKEK